MIRADELCIFEGSLSELCIISLVSDSGAFSGEVGFSDYEVLNDLK